MFGRGRCRLCCFLRLLFGHLCNDQTNVVVAELLQHMLARCRFVFVVGELPLLGKAKPAVFGQVRMERLEILVDWSFFFFFFFNVWLFVVVFLATIIRSLALCRRCTVVLQPSCLVIQVNINVRVVGTTGRSWFLQSIPSSPCVQGKP